MNAHALKPAHPVRGWVHLALAAVALAAIALPQWALWPVEFLGYYAEGRDGAIVYVAPGSVADRAGLRTGDRVVRLYDQPWGTVVRRWSVLPLVDAHPRAIPMEVRRGEQVLSLIMPREEPAPGFRAQKASTALLALACWLTGYLLGFRRRHEPGAHPAVSSFWLLLAGCIGAFAFAQFASFPLSAVVQWAMITLLVPLGVYIHLWFPARAVSARAARTGKISVIGAVLALNLALLAWLLLARPSLAEAVSLLSLLYPPAFGAAFLGSALLLARAYCRSAVAHVRRKIRLLASSAGIVAVLWALLLCLPLLAGVETWLPGHLIDLMTGAVPLAYLAAGLAPNLAQLDTLLRRALVATLAATGLMLAGAVIAQLLPSPTVALLALVGAAGLLYQPLAGAIGRVIPTRAQPDRSYRPLQQAAHAMSTSLDRERLAAALIRGLQETFHQPALALYLRAPDESPALHRVCAPGLAGLPETLPAGALMSMLQSAPPVVEAGALHQALAAEPLSPEEESVVRRSGIALWGVLRGGDDVLLGIVLVGIDGSFEPYTDADIAALGQLLAGAGPAFANSSAYRRQEQAEATIRALYHAIQRVQDETSASLAREIHDEIINISVRLNIRALEQLIERAGDPDIRAALGELLASEQSVSQSLRMICEQLHPTGLDDPHGLPAILRGQAERVEAIWAGTCRLDVVGAPVPIAPITQREIFRIAREALTNAVKHAEATEIVVTLRYPEHAGGWVMLTVADNGQTGQQVAPRPGHWGVRNMRESAAAVGGILETRRVARGGTEVAVSFPPAPPDTQRHAVDRVLAVPGAWEKIPHGEEPRSLE